MVGRTRYRLPLSESLERKFAALRGALDIRVLASSADGSPGDDTFRLWRRLPVLDGAAFYGTLPFRVARELRRFRPDAVTTQSPFEAVAVLAGRGLARSRTALIVELHGDWRTFPRLYGSPLRRVLAPLTDRLAPWTLRRANAVRTLSPYTTNLAREAGVEPAAAFVAFTDLEAFTERPPAPFPETPQVLFVGVLERYKNVDGLVAAWRRVAERVPAARLVVVGKGPMLTEIEGLAADLPGRVEHIAELPPEGVASALDDATLLVLPSRHEGLGRVVIEAFARGRGVVASRAGGVLDLVEDGVQGLLVDPEDTTGLADALASVLTRRELAERLGAAASARFADWNQTAEEFARRTKELVDSALN